MNREELKDQVNLLLRVLSLTKYKNRKAGTYSGGNKRKLSVAIAMVCVSDGKYDFWRRFNIGTMMCCVGENRLEILPSCSWMNPPPGWTPWLGILVFCVEFAMCRMFDFCAWLFWCRRHMWEFIRETMQGRCVLLTTHSMEECEALCHRLGIMVKGQLRCLGTPQHLKSKFGRGYQLDLQLEDDEEKSYLSVEQELSTVFDIRLIERNQSKVTFELLEDDKDIEEMNGSRPSTLAEIFRALERFKRKLPIVSYALNQTTLEQIFIRMAKQHNAISEF